MNEKLNKFIYEDCGLYIAKDNDEVTRKEIEFVCERLIKELLQYGILCASLRSLRLQKLKQQLPVRIP